MKLNLYRIESFEKNLNGLAIVPDDIDLNKENEMTSIKIDILIDHIKHGCSNKTADKITKIGAIENLEVYNTYSIFAQNIDKMVQNEKFKFVFLNFVFQIKTVDNKIRYLIINKGNNFTPTKFNKHTIVFIEHNFGNVNLMTKTEKDMMLESFVNINYLTMDDIIRRGYDEFNFSINRDRFSESLVIDLKNHTNYQPGFEITGFFTEKSQNKELDKELNKLIEKYFHSKLKSNMLSTLSSSVGDLTMFCTFPLLLEETPDTTKLGTHMISKCLQEIKEQIFNEYTQNRLNILKNLKQFVKNELNNYLKNMENSANTLIG